jgi:hypothetical protein
VSTVLFDHEFTTYDEMVQETIDWYAKGLKEWKVVKRNRERERRKTQSVSPAPLPRKTEAT